MSSFFQLIFSLFSEDRPRIDKNPLKMLLVRPLGCLMDPLWCQVHAFVIFETIPCERVPSFGTHFRYFSSVFFCWSLNIYKKGALERGVESGSKKDRFLDPLGPSGECWRLHASSILTFSSSTLPGPLVEQFWDQIGARNLHYTLMGGQVGPFGGSNVEVKFCCLVAMGCQGGP